MKLYKYLLKKPNKNLIKCSNLQSVYIFKGFTLTDSIPCGIFLASNNFNRSDLAQGKLSVTYRPKYKSTIDTTNKLNIKGNYGIKLSSDDPDDNYSRVWPAFGYTGGGFEYIYDCEKECDFSGIKTIGVPIEYPTGGLKDFFYGKSARFMPIGQKAIQEFINKLINNVYEATPEEKMKINFKEDKERVNVVKIEENVFEFASIKLGNSGGPALNFSLSLGTKDFQSFSPVYSVCNLWATLWEDDFQKKERTVYGPISRSWIYVWHNYKVNNTLNQFISLAGVGSTLTKDIIHMYHQNNLVTRKGLVLP
jgi:hypothetical protein